jgi:hypothetical protein
MQRGIAPSVFYDAGVIGVTNAQLQEQRKALKKVVGGAARTASVTATLAVGGERFDDVDPATSPEVLKPIHTVAAALWEGQ